MQRRGIKDYLLKYGVFFMKMNLKWSFFFLWSCLFTLRFFMKSLLINNGEAFILRFLGLLALALLYGLFVRFTVPFKKEQIKIFRGIFVLLSVSTYLEYYIFYLPNGFLTEGILNIVIDALPMVLLCGMAWGIENKLCIVLQNIYRNKKSIYTLWNKQLIRLTEDSDRKKETVFPAFSILSIVFSLVLLYFLMENNFALWLASFSAVLSVYFPQCMRDKKINWKQGLAFACLAPSCLSVFFYLYQMQEDQISLSFFLKFLIEQVLGIIEAIVVLVLLQKNETLSTKEEDSFINEQIATKSL